MLPGDGAHDPGHELRRAARGGRREVRERLDEPDDVVVRESTEEIEQAQDRRVWDPSQELEGAFELTWLELRNEPDGAVEEADEDQEGGQPLAQRRELGVARVRREGLGGFALLGFEDGNDRVAFANLALGDDPAEPLPVVTDREIGGPGGSAAADPSWFRDPLDDPPRLGLGQGKARRSMAQPECLADLAFREWFLASHEICLDTGDRGRHAPCRAHVAPGFGQLDADLLRGLRPPGRAVRGGRARNVIGNLRLDSSVFIAHNLLYESSSLGRDVTMGALAHDGLTPRPSGGRLGALATVTPITMLLAWLLISGWDINTRSFAFAAAEYAIAGVSAGWIVGSRVDRSVAGGVIGAVAYGFVGWLVLVPINVAGAVWSDAQAGRVSDVLGIAAAAGGYLMYGLIVGAYVFAFLLPVGAGWMVTFVLLSRVLGR